ncbi:MAG: AI-2E family transporter [Candidatus Andeanibacterium colombiense]|uniref:AI-2E family transporter n=1 Tax=Candidatus Andeanibacterium colombiense TaxID=3121345 RepID=A0AAJ5X9E1_9SPHN|nr:MAG: AI-2E family transporter [Sphingomonadaceae bacterium]
MVTRTRKPAEEPASPPLPAHAGAPRARTLAFAAQELRLISALVLLLATGLFLALPFVLSIGSVVFLPLVSAIILTIVLSPLADRLASLGVPNILASFLTMVLFFAGLLAALVTILSPAVDLFDQVPAMIARVGERFTELRGSLVWIDRLNEQLTQLAGKTEGQKVVLAGPSFLEEVAVATPSVVLEVLLTLLMAFFMIEARVRMRNRLLLHHASFSTSIKAARVMHDVQDRVAKYIITVTLINAGVGLVVALGAWLLGLNAPIMWGGLAALLNFLPYVGPMTMIAILGLFGLGTADTIPLGLVPALCFLGLHAVESNVITPAILGARFTMNPVLILLALSYFSWIWGVPGALLSVPILLTITAVVDHLGHPNLLGFLFGEPLFPSEALEGPPEETPA